ncbi:DUF421 domain-containing protein [Paenalkalicoccus suaedae]|uniref:DUF421 domain-containing protein n=1 Tax=Paenalkalicoccus suaedae TaxID=2592382 RepID=A0A859F9Y7_9BACI|nr:DUF421 domain-containing protein [Paenalkalicoccus suaedae]QKS69969.1 DUF421 domain-containing protein [Paenalkalicoccus suaedae]
MEILVILLRSVLAFGLLLVGARLLGKQTISGMTMFDFIATITIGAIAANLAFDSDIAPEEITTAFAVFVGVLMLIGYGSLKHHGMRKWFAGDPTVVIEDGHLLEKNMRKMRYSIDYLNHQLREKQVFNIEEVAFALVEPNGTLSVQLKPAFRPVTRHDIGIFPARERLPVELIMDGQLIEQNLRENNVALQQVERALLDRGISRVEDVAYAVLGQSGRVYVDTYKDDLEQVTDEE